MVPKDREPKNRERRRGGPGRGAHRRRPTTAGNLLLLMDATEVTQVTVLSNLTKGALTLVPEEREKSKL